MIGRRVGNYRVEKLLGSGGMGAVYLVRHRQLPNTVAALKVLKGEMASYAVTQRFVQEALVAAAIGGHRVARPLDLGRFDDASPYILMELVEGRTLAERLAEGPLALPVLIGIAYRVADTMALAHARGIIHRDLKPSNIMLVGSSQVKLLDFGVAQAAGELKLAETREAAIIGTPGYLSPEAASGTPVDGKSDVFSLGVVMFKMATGDLPFPAKLDPMSLKTLLAEPAPLVSSKRDLGEVGAVLDGIVASALEKDADKRPSMAELRDRLHELYGAVAPDEEPSALPPTPTPTPSTRADLEESTVTDAVELDRLRKQVEHFALTRMGTSRPKWPFWLAALAVLAVAVAGTAWRWPRSTPPARRAALVEQHQVTFHGNASSLGLSPDGKNLAFLSGERVMLMDLASQAERQMGTEAYRLPRWLPDSTAFEGGLASGEAMRYSLVGGEPQKIPYRYLAVYRPMSDEMASASLPWKRVDILHEDKVVRQLPVGGDYTWLFVRDWSGDGKHILVQTDTHLVHTLYTLGADDGKQEKLVEERIEITSPHFTTSPPGVAYLRVRSGGERDLVWLPLQHGAAAGEARTVIEGFQAEEFSLSIDGKRMAYTRSRGANELWMVSAGSPPSAHRLLADAAPKSDPSLSPDGRWIAFCASDGPFANLFVIPVGGGQPRRLSTQAGEKGSPVWSPDGTRLAYTVTVGSERTIYVVPLSGGEPRRIAADGISSDGGGMVWAPSRFLAFHPEGNQNYQLVDPDSGERRKLLSAEEGWPFELTWAPDLNRFAIYFNRKLTHKKPGLYLMALDGSVDRLLAEEQGFLPLGWSSDGKWLRAGHGDDPGGKREVVEVSADGGTPRPWLSLPIESKLGVCIQALDGVHLVCTAGGDSDVWMIDDFDKLL
jgi:serine/threonine protein kinase/Tol biopolymer transport system component